MLKSNLRQLVEARLKETGRECRCIRCREVGQNDVLLEDPDKVVLKDLVYTASGGEEHFINYTYEDKLIGYVRLRLDENDSATIRELKVFGRMARIGKDGEDWQHRGFGKELVADAERIAREKGRTSIRITSGVGVRGYYRTLGYELAAPYMVKRL